MEKTYTITGMTCGGCVTRIKNKLESLPQTDAVKIQLESPQATIKFNKSVDINSLQNVVNEAGSYMISEVKSAPSHFENDEEEKKSLGTYKPLFLIVAFIAGFSLLTQYPFSNFSGMLWMRYFMAGFFIVFAFFKLLNLSGFANSYMMYDIIAAKWKSWGYIYPFVELSLGILYLLNIAPLFTNSITAIVLGISSIGVIKSNLNKQKIKCACLGDVFNLPMSTITIVEDVAMVAMALIMIANDQIL